MWRAATRSQIDSHGCTVNALPGRSTCWTQSNGDWNHNRLSNKLMILTQQWLSWKISSDQLIYLFSWKIYSYSLKLNKLREPGGWSTFPVFANTAANWFSRLRRPNRSKASKSDTSNIPAELLQVSVIKKIATYSNYSFHGSRSNRCKNSSTHWDGLEPWLSAQVPARLFSAANTPQLLCRTGWPQVYRLSGPAPLPGTRLCSLRLKCLEKRMPWLLAVKRVRFGILPCFLCSCFHLGFCSTQFQFPPSIPPKKVKNHQDTIRINQV